jgi:hypothetical protein
MTDHQSTLLFLVFLLQLVLVLWVGVALAALHRIEKQLDSMRDAQEPGAEAPGS